MQIMVNGEAHETEEGITVRGLLIELGLTGPVAVERNGEVVTRARHDTQTLSPGDILELVHFVGGG